MQKIIEYVNERFLDLPKTEEIANLKANLIESMTEKYNHLIEEGKSAQEAFGIVIYDFGSMSDIKKELGINDNSFKTMHNENKLFIELNTFLKKMLYLGLSLCGMGLILFMFFSILSTAFIDTNIFLVTNLRLCGIAALFFGEILGIIFLIIFAIKSIQKKNSIPTQEKDD